MAKTGATGDFFFTFAKKKIIFKWTIFSYKKKKKEKKKKKNCGRPTGFNSSRPLDRKHFFFMDSLRHIIENLICISLSI